MPINIYRDPLQKAYLFGTAVLYSEKPVPQEDVPQHWYCYELRGTTLEPDRPYALVDLAIEHYAGSILSPLPLKKETAQSRLLKGKFELTSEHIHLSEFCSEYLIPQPETPIQHMLRPASPDEAGLSYALPPEKDGEMGLTEKGRQMLRDAADPSLPHEYSWYVIQNITRADQRVDRVLPLDEAIKHYMELDSENAFFYDSAEGLLTAVILLLAEFLPPKEIDGQLRERRHIVSVFKLVQDLLEPSKVKGKSCFQVLMSRLPSEHKARWFAGAALNTSEQAMASVLSTVLSRLNAFLDTELEQTICFDSPLDAESFASKKSAIFLVLPEEDQTKNFMAGLMIQNLSRELFSVADENGGKLKNRVVLFCDEFGTMPPFDVLSLFSAGRSRKLTMLPIIQSLAQLEKNYGKEGSEIIQDNCQDTIFGGFAPNSKTAEELSRSLGSYTVQSGSISRSKGENSQSLQMAERALMTPDELKSIPKGEFVVMKTGTHPMRTRLRLFLDWGITFGEPYQTPEHGQRKVYYAGREELENAIVQRLWTELDEAEQDRAIQRGRFGQRNNERRKQEDQAGQPLVTASNFAKKQDATPPASEGG